MLRCPVEELTRVESTADNLYREVKQVKRDGTLRLCYDAKSPLKGMQARIKCMILRAVSYPSYLMGGLSDPDNPRDYVRNAKVHTGARVLIKEDIANFFPTTSFDVIFDIWKYFFHFPPDVSRTLARLTTRQGCLPQGAKTSSHLANLVFWACEPELVSVLASGGFKYTRFIDDVAISSRTDKTAQQIHEAISLLASMIVRYGFRLKRSKHSLLYAGQRMEVTGLAVGRDCAGLGRTRKSNIRPGAHEEEQHSRPGAHEEEQHSRPGSPMRG